MCLKSLFQKIGVRIITKQALTHAHKHKLEDLQFFMTKHWTNKKKITYKIQQKETQVKFGDEHKTNTLKISDILFYCLSKKSKK